MNVKMIGSIGAIIIVILIILIFIGKESYSNENENIERNDKNDRNEIREDFPASSMNVLYSDANGNLSSTKELGLQTLSLNGGGDWVPTLAINAPVADSSLYSIYFGNSSNVHDQTGGQCGIGYISTNKNIGGTRDRTLATHIPSQNDITYYSSGWDPLFSVKGGTGNTHVKGSLNAGSISTGGSVSAGSISATGNLNTGGSISSGGNLSAVHINTSGNISAGDNVYAKSNFVLNGSKDASLTNAPKNYKHNQWIFHTPNYDDRRTLYIAPIKDDYSDWKWDKGVSIDHNGNLSSPSISSPSITTSGVINFPNGWKIDTTGGHFRIQHNGVDKGVFHTTLSNSEKVNRPDAEATWTDVLYVPGGVKIPADKDFRTGVWRLSGSSDHSGDLTIQAKKDEQYPYGDGRYNAIMGRYDTGIWKRAN